MELLAASVAPCVAEMTNGIGMEYAYVPAGTFLMGSPPEEEGHRTDEGPVHEVEITRGFWLGKYPVTQAEYRAVTGKHPSHFSNEGGGKERVAGMDTDRFPVELVSENEAASFCKTLGWSQEQGRARQYRLPTEAEWEYACRAGVIAHPFHFGSTLISDRANVAGGLGRTTRVGSYPPNAIGLHDTHDNFREWCADRFAEDAYSNSERKDPRGPDTGNRYGGRVLRGGSWGRSAPTCRSAFRDWGFGASAASDIGFRVCFTPSD